MNFNVRATEAIARDVISGQFEEIQGYTNPTNDGILAAWMTALERAQRMVGTLQTVCDSISHRAPVSTGNLALRQVAAQPCMDCHAVEAVMTGLNQIAAAKAYGIPTETPEEREELDRVEQIHVHPVFAPLLSGLRIAR